MSDQHVPSGAIMVVGSGIGGMQASIDLADSGFKVYLVERDTAIGGRMAQLDKTFPTNDCAMCIISPKLIEVGSHPDIELLTGSEVLGVEGEPGHMKVRVLRHPRYVDIEKCTGCGECAKVCPIERLNAYNMDRNERKAIYKRYPQAIPGAYAIEKRGTAPCRDACPAHQSAMGYVALVAAGRFDEALDVVRRDNPLPAICGRVCAHPCEQNCTRNGVDDPVAVRSIKRFLSDYEIEKYGKPKTPPPGEDTGKKVAIVGSGPAGLAAAYYLRRQGHEATIYDAAPKAGGMLRLGIPDYRLPPEILDREIEAITGMGAKLELNYPVGKDGKSTVQDLMDGNDAVFLAIGAHDSSRLNLPGEDSEGVLHGVDFLRRVNLGDHSEVGKKVAVVGGGAVAADVARTALRLGAESVEMFCLESRDEMPAWQEDIEDLEEEHITINNSWGPKEFVLEDGKLKSVQFKRCTQVFDEEHRFNPQYDENEINDFECDTVIIAIGQRILAVDLLEGTDGVELTSRGTIKANPVTMETSHGKVFAGGDAQTGPSLAIEAIAAGRRAAESIDRMLKGEDIRAGREWKVDVAIPSIEGEKPVPRHHESKLDLDYRLNGFSEVSEKPLSAEEAIDEAKRCLRCGICAECMLCVEACKAGAIDHTMMPKIDEIEVGSVVLAPGFDQFDARAAAEYGYGRWKNVLTGMEFERMLSATGPSSGHLKRPSDGVEPKKVAWIQCVASRDQRMDHGYCSGVCCMFATKEAVIASEHAGGDFDATVFYMEMRATGKGFDDYVDRAKNKYGVRYIRSMVSRVDEMPETKNVRVTYLDEEGKSHEEEFDMLVLSAGLTPTDGIKELAKRLDIELNHYGFAKTNNFDPVGTTRPGVYVSGVFQGPKDIPETVAQASGAASYAMTATAKGRGTQLSTSEAPPEKDFSGDARIGVFICRCGINIASTVDVIDVAEYAKTLPGVVYSEEVLFSCSQDNQENIKKQIKEHNLNRLVVASCTPRTHEPLFQKTLEETGVNRYLFSMANIREQCSWVHSTEPEKATAKAKDLVRMAIANAHHLKPLYKRPQSLIQSGLVLGGGLAGMTAALQMADQGFDVTLVEKNDVLGGNMRFIYRTHDGMDVQKHMKELIEKVQNHPLITLHLGATFYKTGGFLGNFESEIKLADGSTRTIYHGTTIVAIGAQESKPETFGYGQDDRIVTQMQLEGQVWNEPEKLKDAKDFVMIQCVGSRDENRKYCSKLCCSQALKNSIQLKEEDPERDITILFREMRSYGLKEELFTKARRLGVRFVRFDLDNLPEVKLDGDRPVVEVNDDTAGPLSLPADRIALAAAIDPPKDSVNVAELLKVPRTTDGFFLEVHQKLAPVSFASDGIFLCGLAHGPKPAEETIAQAAATAAKAATVLAKPEMMVGGQVSVVDPDKCAVCLCCVRACPYGVPVIHSEDGAAYIEPAECQGCGVCASECPGKAIQLQHFSDAQIAAMTRVAVGDDFGELPTLPAQPSHDSDESRA